MLDLYRKALTETGLIMATVEPEMMDSATPCAGWDVRALLGHILGATEMYAAGGLVPGAVFEPAHVGADHLAVYDRAAKSAWEIFAAPGAMERTFRLPPGELPGSVVLGIALAEAAVHGWDLATATGRPATIDPEIAEPTLGFLRQVMAPEFRAGPHPYFGPEVPVGNDAPPSDRLVGFLGRKPPW